MSTPNSQSSRGTHRQNISGGAPWEAKVGYSRAVRVGNQLLIAGTVAVDDDGAIIAPGDAYQQTKAILAKFDQILAEAGSGLHDVVRTRSFITDINQWEQFGRAHGEAFGEIRPAATLVEVSGLMGEGAVIEIEADAIIASPAPPSP